MAYWSVAVLLVTVGFLIYRHPDALRKASLARTSQPPPELRIEEEETRNLNGNSSVGEREHSKQDRSKSESIDVDDGEVHEDDQRTPKANATAPREGVPTFSLDSSDHNGSNLDDLESEPQVPSFPAAHSAQRASPSRLGQPLNSGMPPPARPSPSPSSSAGLMPPPARPKTRPTTLAAPVSTSASPRITSTGPLPNRGPPPNSAQRVSAAGGGGSSSLTVNGTALSTPNSRGKVLLKPGHSPMDWAALIKRGNISGVSSFQRVTPSQLRSMTGRKGKPAWSSWQGKVYNITPYLPFHPGGEAELMKAAGRDGAKLFMEVHPWVNWENMLGSCLVGTLVPEEQSPLDDMD